MQRAQLGELDRRTTQLCCWPWSRLGHVLQKLHEQGHDHQHGGSRPRRAGERQIYRRLRRALKNYLRELTPEQKAAVDKQLLTAKLKAEYDDAQHELPRRLQAGDLDAPRETRRLGEQFLIAQHIAYAKAAKAKALEGQDFAATNRLFSLADSAKALEKELRAEAEAEDEEESIANLEEDGRP